MVKIINVDTDILRSAVYTAKQTNDAITEACTKLNQVVVHNDWTCKERTQLNERTVTNRQTAQEIQNNSSAFYEAISQASSDFDQAEQSNISNVNTIDGEIAKIVSVVQGISGGIGSVTAISSFSDVASSLEE